MDKLDFILPVSAWWLVLGAVVAALYAYIMYGKGPDFWTLGLRYGVSAVRFFLVFLVILLLTSILLRSTKTKTIRPITVLAIDNSSSVASYGRKFGPMLTKLAADLDKAGTDLALFDLSGPLSSLDSVRYNAPATDLNQMLNQIAQTYEGQNLSRVILFSDGIVNRGISPAYRQYPFELHALAVGDTLVRRDIMLKNLYYNRIAYLGNSFPIRTELMHSGFSGATVRVSLGQGTKTLQTKTLRLPANGVLSEVIFMVSNPTKAGLQSYKISIFPLSGEHTLINNSATAYIDIIEKKENILIVASAPHPDIKTFKTALSQETNRQTEVYFASDNKPFPKGSFDLIILHNIPNIGGASNAALEKALQSRASLLFVVGIGTDLPRFSQICNVLSVQQAGSVPERTSLKANKVFERFVFENEWSTRFDKMPPLLAPYGTYTLRPQAEIVAFQAVGSVVTTKPLIALQLSQDRKMGVMMAEGWWQWGLQEFAAYQSRTSLDGMIQKLVQLLSSPDEKGRFRITTTSKIYQVQDPVLFLTEFYNDIFEKIYDQKIDLQIADQSGKKYRYSYQNTENGAAFEVAGLPGGSYSYTGSTVVGGKTYYSKGAFSVDERSLEDIERTADFGLLRTLATNSNGQIAYLQRSATLPAAMLAPMPAMLRTNDELEPIMNYWPLLALILALASLEWAIRKVNGAE